MEKIKLISLRSKTNSQTQAESTKTTYLFNLGENMIKKSIYSLSLHEEMKVADNLWCRRVPGGWIYTDTGTTDEGHIIFVPFDNEYQEEK